MLEGFILSDEDREAAISRDLRKGGFVCIGGIGVHGKCYSHFPPCPYCIPALEPPTEAKDAIRALPLPTGEQG